MSEFIKPYTESPVFATPEGNQYEPQYLQRYDKHGRPYLEKVGEKNIVAVIRSNAETCNYEKIIRRFEMTGDLSLINKTIGTYADLTGIPSNLIEAYNSIEAAKRIFENLPLEKRKDYGFNFTEFLADFGSDKFVSALGLDVPVVDPVVKEVKKEVIINADE